MFVLQNTRGQKHEKYRVRVDPNIHSHVKLLVENGITKKKDGKGITTNGKEELQYI